MQRRREMINYGKSYREINFTVKREWKANTKKKRNYKTHKTEAENAKNGKLCISSWEREKEEERA